MFSSGSRRDGGVASPKGFGSSLGPRQEAASSSRLSATAEPSAVAWDMGAPVQLPDEITPENPLRVVIAGGGVGGLLSAKYLKMQGFDVSSSPRLKRSILVINVRHAFR